MIRGSGALSDADLPGAWRDADTTSMRGQQFALSLTIAKVGGGVIAAMSAVFLLSPEAATIAQWGVLVGFALALFSELAAWIFQPERDWYEGRAVAESSKTLAWRYAVGADPFPVSMPEAAAKELYRERIADVVDQVYDRVIFESSHATVTPRMDQIRQLSFQERKNIYVEGRTVEQKRWYAHKARLNRRTGKLWTLLLVLAETAAVALAVGQLVGAWAIDLAGLLAAIIGAGATWVAVKQFSPLASAYAVATRELSLQEAKLLEAHEGQWALVAADAEEAISREHTTWVASRTGRSTA